MPRSPRPVSRDEALKAAVEALVILGDAAARSTRPDPDLDEAREAFTLAAIHIATQTEN